MPERHSVDLDAYFARIGHDGPTAPTVDTLHALSFAHVTALPFTNLDILLGQPVDLDTAALQQKLVGHGRGGYCFEHNGLMLAVLRRLGFRVTTLGGRGVLGRPRDEIQPRTHVLLKVDVGGEPWLVDVGAGGFSLTAAIRLAIDVEQATPHERRRLVAEDGRIYHQVLGSDGWTDLYVFTLDELHPIDAEVGNWWTSTHPSSRFKTHLFAARATPDGGRLSLLDDAFKTRRPDGTSAAATVRTQGELRDLLQRHFGLTWPAEIPLVLVGAAWSA